MNPAARDLLFLKWASRQMGVKVPVILWSDSRAKHPDLWTDGRTITVTREWARQSQYERWKRLVHELLHIQGLQHGVIDGRLYSTRPQYDEFSQHVLSELLQRMPVR